MIQTKVFALLAVTLAVAATLTTASPTRVSASSGALRVDPATQSVPPGATFVVSVIGSADAATVGAQTTIDFDPSLLQIQDVQPGPAWANASVVIAAPRDPNNPAGAGAPPTIQDAIGIANATSGLGSGELRRLATLLVPGSGSAPSGENVVAIVTMQAIAAGTSPIHLSDTEMIDEQGNSLEVSGTDGSIVIDGGAPVPPSGDTPTAAAGPTSAAQASPAGGIVTPAAVRAAAPAATPASGVLGTSQVASLTTASLSISPGTQSVAKDATFSFELKQNVDGASNALQAKVTFQRNLLQVVKLEPGAGWTVAQQALDAAVKDANNSGEINITLQANKTGGPPAGESTVVTVTMQGQPGKQGKSDIKITSQDILGGNGTSVTAKVQNGSVVVGNAGGGMSAIWVIVGGVVLVVVIAAGAYVVRRRTQTA